VVGAARIVEVASAYIIIIEVFTLSRTRPKLILVLKQFYTYTRFKKLIRFSLGVAPREVATARLGCIK